MGANTNVPKLNVSRFAFGTDACVSQNAVAHVLLEPGVSANKVELLSLFPARPAGTASCYTARPDSANSNPRWTWSD